MCLGITVLIGWLIGSRAITQIHPSFAVMQFNTAFVFALCGLSLTFLIFEKNTYSLFFTVAIGMIGSITLSQYIFGTNTGIDLLFFNSPLISASAFPGRMSPTTSFCFTLSAAMLAVLGFQSKNRALPSVAQFGGIFIGCIGAISLFGYLTGANLIEAWSSYIRVAVHTSAGLLLLGSGIFLQAQAQAQAQAQKAIYFSSAVAIVGLIALALGFVNFQMTNDFISSSKKEAHFEELIGKITHLDEVLTMSARLAASTGEKRWEDRYNQFDPILADAINELVKNFPELTIAKQTDLANQKLVEMERKSFALVRGKLNKNALALLFSEEYEKQKLLYNTGMEESKSELNNKVKMNYAHHSFNTILVGSISLLFLVFSFVGWIIVTRQMKFVNKNLTALAASLEERVKEATQTIVRQAKLASLGEMSAGLAHEINNPLAIIQGSVNLIPKFANDPEKLTARIETINKASGRIAKIVNGLKKFSRSDVKSILKSHSLSKIVKEAEFLIEVKAKRHDTTITYDFRSDGNIECNEIEIEQVVVNLINNAIDAVKDNTEKWVKISVYEDGKNIVMRVVDSGHGIPENARDKLFNPFFTTKVVGEGTGLGLSISKGILDEHKATIAVLPTGPNTCFEIRFQKSEGLQEVLSAA
jgi:signal transduction histidine kinase